MSSASRLFVCSILLCITGVTLADEHQSVSTDAIIALACVFGFIGTALLLSGVCYCVRRQRYRDNRRRQEKLAIVSKVFKEEQEKKKHEQLQQEQQQQQQQQQTETVVKPLPVQPVVLRSHPVDDLDNTPTPSQSNDSMVVEKQRYNQWRQSMAAPSLLMTTGPTAGQDTRYVFRQRANTGRSVSPSRINTLVERGRSRQKVIYTNGSTYNNGNIGTIVTKRSRSAPAVHHQHHQHHQHVDYVPGGPKPIYFTKSHFMAIKQPFSKKFLLPPTRYAYSEKPMVQKQVIYTQPPPQRQVVEVQRTVAPPPPPPQKQEVIQGNVYHVQYKPGPNQTVTYPNGEIEPYQYTNGNLSQSRVYTSSSQQSPRVITSTSQYSPRYYTSKSQHSPRYDSSNSYDYEEYGPNTTIITPQSSSNYAQYTQAHSDSKTKVIPATNEWYGNSIYVEPRHQSNSSDDVFMRTSSMKIESVQSGKPASTVKDDFTIVDYVGDDARNDVKVITTSTPRFPSTSKDNTALQDLDNILNSDHDSTASEAGSSSSSSSSSTKKSSN